MVDYLEPLSLNAKWCLPIIAMMDIPSGDVSPSVANKNETSFDHYVTIQPMPKMDDFFGATLNLLEPVCFNAKWCLSLMDFSLDGLSPSVANKKATTF